MQHIQLTGKTRLPRRAQASRCLYPESPKDIPGSGLSTHGAHGTQADPLTQILDTAYCTQRCSADCETTHPQYEGYFTSLRLIRTRWLPRGLSHWSRHGHRNHVPIVPARHWHVHHHRLLHALSGYSANLLGRNTLNWHGCIGDISWGNSAWSLHGMLSNLPPVHHNAMCDISQKHDRMPQRNHTIAMFGVAVPMEPVAPSRLSAAALLALFSAPSACNMHL